MGSEYGPASYYVSWVNVNGAKDKASMVHISVYE